MVRIRIRIFSTNTLNTTCMGVLGKEYRNTPAGSVTAVTWGVFPGQEIIQVRCCDDTGGANQHLIRCDDLPQRTVVDSASFEAWKDEAFELWQAQWASVYEPDSVSHQIIQVPLMKEIRVVSKSCTHHSFFRHLGNLRFVLFDQHCGQRLHEWCVLDKFFLHVFDGA